MSLCNLLETVRLTGTNPSHTSNPLSPFSHFSSLISCRQVTMYDCMISSQFGTYLCNFEKERKEAKLKDRTHSVWSYIYSRLEDFLNPLYDIGEPAHQAYLFPELGLQHYKPWISMYCRSVHPKPYSFGQFMSQREGVKNRLMVSGPVLQTAGKHCGERKLALH